LNETVSIPALAKKTIGFSGAELENLLNESALTAAANDKKFIDNEDIENAFFKIIMDGNKKPRKEVDEDTYLTAWHEAGHTLATKLLTKDGVPTVTIIQSTSGAGGVTFMAPDEKNLPSKKYLRNKIKVDYAGRAAEEIYLGNSDDITTGASQDIKQATAVIKSYIGAYGMGSKGLIDIKQLTAQYDIVEEAAELSNMLYQETLELLRANEDKLRALADALIAKETLYEDEIDEILGIIKLDKTEKVESVEAVVEEVAVEEVQEEPVEMESEKTDTEAVLIEE
jgi:cell division protease FtsH